MNLSFSIIVPIYKTKLEQLDECLKSLLVQDRSLLKEIILVNDGNSEEYRNQLLELIEKYKLDNELIKIVDIQNHNGPANARLNGFNNSSSQIIIFVDSDDYIIDKLFLNKICSYFTEHKEIGLVSYDLAMFSKKVKIKSKKPKYISIENFSAEYFFNKSYRNFIPIHSIAFKRDVLQNNKILFNQINEYLEDVYFLAALLSLNVMCLITNEQFYGYRWNNNSITQTVNKKTKKDSTFIISITHKWLTEFSDFNINNSNVALDVYINSCIDSIIANGYAKILKQTDILPNKQEIINFCNKYKFLSIRKMKVKMLKLMMKSKFWDYSLSFSYRTYLKIKNLFRL